MRIAPSIKKGRGGPCLFIKGVLSSLMCVLLLPPIPEGVIGIKPRGDTQKGFFFLLPWTPAPINRTLLSLSIFKERGRSQKERLSVTLIPKTLLWISPEDLLQFRKKYSR